MPRCIENVPTNQPMVIANGSYGYPAGGAQIWAPGSTTNCTMVAFTQAEYDALKTSIATLEANGGSIKVDVESDPQRVQDMNDVFYMFLLVCVTVWGVKQLLNLFTGDTDRG